MKQHWYCFSYVGKSLVGGENCEVSTYSGLPSQKITKDIIGINKQYAGVSNNAVLISCSYLGYMTREEFLR